MFCQQCGAEIAAGARFCKGCGRAPTTAARPKFLFTILGILLLLVLVAIAVGNRGGVARPDALVTQREPRTAGKSLGEMLAEQQRQPRTDRQRVIPQPAIIRKAHFDSLYAGITYDQVRIILGKDGEERSRSDLAGTTTIMYAWKNWDGSNMNAMFQNGRLVTKAQFGLR